MTLALIYRPLVTECFDPLYLRAVGVGGGLYHAIFLVLVVLNLVASFQALGTLMAVGLMMVPAAAARFWAREVWSLALTSSAIGLRLRPDRPARLLSCRAALGAGDHPDRERHLRAVVVVAAAGRHLCRALPAPVHMTSNSTGNSPMHRRILLMAGDLGCGPDRRPGSAPRCAAGQAQGRGHNLDPRRHGRAGRWRARCADHADRAGWRRPRLRADARPTPRR